LATRVAENVLGQVLLFKIAEVRVAQPGVYPILKPREIKQWLRYDGMVMGEDAQASFEEFLVQARLPWIRPDMAFIPCPPFTVVGFNATTDVFLAPATERAIMTVESAERAEVTDLGKDKADITEAMTRRQSDFPNDPNLVNNQAIKVDRNPSGNRTVITIAAPPTPGLTFSGSEDAIKRWVIDVFSPSGTQKLQETDIAISKSADMRILIVTVDVNITDLAERARKVK
jgi:hypothetical protein